MRWPFAEGSGPEKNNEKANFEKIEEEDHKAQKEALTVA